MIGFVVSSFALAGDAVETVIHKNQKRTKTFVNAFIGCLLRMFGRKPNHLQEPGGITQA